MLIEPKKLFDIWSEELTVPILALDVVIFTVYQKELCIVVSKVSDESGQGYSIPGGIVAKGFDLETNFDDILQRKTGIMGVYKEQLYTFGSPTRDSRGHVIAVCYYALVSVDSFLTKVDFTKVDIIKFSDMGKYRFFYDHDTIIHYAKQRLEWKLEYTNIAKEILPKKFRLSALQEVYEIIMGKKYDKRNFQKKVFSLKLLQEHEEKDRSSHRPAKLYSFKEGEIMIVEKNSFV